ncbi:MAG: DUF2344 domain-containing protein [Peptostreptococcaceae bacterium]|nr:DUF2344 domain-containing protein [Peptostreptococcaceae bacterium]
MHRYIIRFSKLGYIKYISHLDLMRLFKRTFKRMGIKLEYSQGYNPHPKMGLAQPLSLGYESSGEILEFETVNNINDENIIKTFNMAMPEGIKIIEFKEIKAEGKSLAAITEFAEYRIKLPFKDTMNQGIEVMNFINQSEIISQKLNKKKELIDLDIKSMIKELAINKKEDELIIFAKLDAGSVSNLSPELLIKAIGDYYQIEYDRSEVEITREAITFTKKLQF